MNKIARFLTAICALAAISLPAAAESHYKPHISVGAHGGMSMSRMSFSPSIDQSWLSGPQVGVQFRYAEEELVGLIGEINFTQRGWKENFKDNPELEYHRTMTYIEIPVMTHIYFGSRRFKGFVNLGPQVGYMMGDKITSNFDYSKPHSAGIPATRHTEQLTMKIKNNFDYGITAGAGAEYYLKPRHSVYVECRFYYGLGNIFPASKADVFGASRVMSLQFTAGYNFRLK